MKTRLLLSVLLGEVFVTRLELIRKLIYVAVDACAARIDSHIPSDSSDGYFGDQVEPEDVISQRR